MRRLLRSKARSEGDPEADQAHVWNFYYGAALKASDDLRKSLGHDENSFKRIDPMLWDDARPIFVYRVLDEVQKAGICIKHWSETLSENSGDSKPDEHFTRIVTQWVQDDQSFRTRKLIEALVEVICFSETNEAEYYRDFFRLKALDKAVRSVADQETFFGFRRKNTQFHIDSLADDIKSAENTKIDPSRRWYVRGKKTFQETWKSQGVDFSSFRTRYISILAKCYPTELAVIGKSYLHAYGVSSEIHFSSYDTSSAFDPKEVYLGVDRVGLLCLAIIIRCQNLLETVPEGVNRELREMHDNNSGPANAVRGLKTPNAQIGDFVWVQGDICEVVDVKKSSFGYVSYLLRYLELPPIPEIKEDWFAGFETRLVAERSFVLKAIESLQADSTVDSATKLRFRTMTEQDQSSLIRKTVLALWKAQQQLRRPADPSQGADQIVLKFGENESVTVTALRRIK